MSPALVLEDLARPLLVLHAVAGILGAALAMHVALKLLAWHRSGGRGRYTLAQRFSSWSAFALVLAALTGFAVYPTYRVRVAWERWHDAGAAFLAFEAKEHAAVLVVAAVIGLKLALGEPLERDHGRRLVFLTGVVAAAAAGVCLAGLWVTLAGAP
jgi:hypothetical protein